MGTFSRVLDRTRRERSQVLDIASPRWRLRTITPPVPSSSMPLSDSVTRALSRSRDERRINRRAMQIFSRPLHDTQMTVLNNHVKSGGSNVDLATLDGFPLPRMTGGQIPRSLENPRQKAFCPGRRMHDTVVHWEACTSPALVAANRKVATRRSKLFDPRRVFIRIA